MFLRLVVAILVAVALCNAAKMPFKSNVKIGAKVSVKDSVKPVTAPKSAFSVPKSTFTASKPAPKPVSKPAPKSIFTAPKSVSKPAPKPVAKSAQKGGEAPAQSALYGNLITKSEERPLILSAVKKVPAVQDDEVYDNTDYKTAIGVTAPLGFFDPLGLLKNPAVSEVRFQRLRQTEIKHGRISMLAILGHIMTTSGMRLPGDIWFGVPFSSVKNGLAAFDTIPIPFTVCFIAFIGLLDTGFNRVKEGIEQDCVDYMNGVNWSEEKQNYKRNIELNQGRAAQMGILALMVHEKLDNNPYIINDLLGFPVPFNQ